MQSNKNIIELNDATIGVQNEVLFSHFSFALQEHSTTCIMAPSGSGKTTLLNYILNKQLAEGKKVSYLFQEDRLLPTASIWQNIALPLLNCMGKEEANERALAFLRVVSLEDRASSLPSSLSGGERQRVAMARSFAYPSRIILMDEPFQSQDLRTKQSLFKAFLELCKAEKRTVLFATHDEREAVAIADRIVVMDKRPMQILLDITNDAVSKEPNEKAIRAVFQTS